MIKTPRHWLFFYTKRTSFICFVKIWSFRIKFENFFSCISVLWHILILIVLFFSSTEVTYNNLTNQNHLQNQRNILLERQAAASPSLRHNALAEESEKKSTPPPPKAVTPVPAKPAKKKRKKKNSVTANLGGTKYEISEYYLREFFHRFISSSCRIDILLLRISAFIS